MTWPSLSMSKQLKIDFSLHSGRIDLVCMSQKRDSESETKSGPEDLSASHRSLAPCCGSELMTSRGSIDKNLPSPVTLLVWSKASPVSGQVLTALWSLSVRSQSHACACGC